MYTEFNLRKIGRTGGFCGHGEVNFGFLGGKRFLKDVVAYELYKNVHSILGISLPAVMCKLVEHSLAFWYFLSRVKNVCGVGISLTQMLVSSIDRVVGCVPVSK